MRHEVELIPKKTVYFDCVYWERGNCTYLEKVDTGSFADKFILRPLNIPPNLAIGDENGRSCYAPMSLGLKCNGRLRKK